MKIPPWMQVAAPLLLIVVIVALATSTQRKLELRNATEPPSAPPIETARAVVVPLNVPDLPPETTQGRYQHGIISADAGGRLFSCYLSDPHLDWPGGIVVASATRTATGPPRAERVFPAPQDVHYAQPSVAVGSESGGGALWLSYTEFNNEGCSVVVLVGQTAEQLTEVWRSDPTLERASFPNLLHSATGFPGLMYIAHPLGSGATLGAVKVYLQIPNQRQEPFLTTIPADPAWRAFQPPMAVLTPDGTAALVALKAEYEGTTNLQSPTPESGSIESEALVYWVSFTGGIVTPSTIGPRVALTYHERPVLAIAPEGHAYAALGTWRPVDNPDPTIVKQLGSSSRELRRYTMEIFASADGFTWNSKGEPVEPHTEVATAAPHLAATGERVLLVYAWDASHVASADAHRLLMVESRDRGTTWSKPTLLVAPEEGTMTRDVPMDLVIMGNYAACAFTRLGNATLGSESILATPTDARLRAVIWQLDAPTGVR